MAQARPERHDEPTTDFELLNQRRWDMVKCRRHDHCVERTTFRPSKITVTNFDTYRVLSIPSQPFRPVVG